MGTKALKDEIARLQGEVDCLQKELFEEQTWRAAACHAHAILSRGIKKALKLKNWPDFYKMYGEDMFADSVVRLLNEEVSKLRDNCTKVKHETKRKSRG